MSSSDPLRGYLNSLSGGGGASSLLLGGTSSSRAARSSASAQPSTPRRHGGSAPFLNDRRSPHHHHNNSGATMTSEATMIRGGSGSNMIGPIPGSLYVNANSTPQASNSNSHRGQAAAGFGHSSSGYNNNNSINTNVGASSRSVPSNEYATMEEGSGANGGSNDATRPSAGHANNGHNSTINHNAASSLPHQHHHLNLRYGSSSSSSALPPTSTVGAFHNNSINDTSAQWRAGGDSYHNNSTTTTISNNNNNNASLTAGSAAADGANDDGLLLANVSAIAPISAVAGGDQYEDNGDGGTAAVESSDTHSKKEQQQRITVAVKIRPFLAAEQQHSFSYLAGTHPSARCPLTVTDGHAKGSRQINIVSAFHMNNAAGAAGRSHNGSPATSPTASPLTTPRAGGGGGLRSNGATPTRGGGAFRGLRAAPAVTVAPFGQQSASSSLNTSSSVDDGQPPSSTSSSSPPPHRSFAFDHVFTDADLLPPPSADGDERGNRTAADDGGMYERLVRPVVESVLSEGYNGTVFAYGQTGSGKTHTMNALYHRVGEAVMRSVEGGNMGAGYHQPRCCVELSVMELYNEDLKDLIATTGLVGGNASRMVQTPLKLREDTDGSFQVQGLMRCAVTTYAELMELISAATANRTTNRTAMNATSSRSHCIVTLVLPHRNRAKIHLVDLAGSERLKKIALGNGHGGAASYGYNPHASHTAAQTLEKESIAINSGLFALGNVINALVLKQQQDATNTSSSSAVTPRTPRANPMLSAFSTSRYGGGGGTTNSGGANSTVRVPYRDSILTRLLKDGLGGNSRTVMIACISPTSSSLPETLNTLVYAQRAKMIRTRPVSAAEKEAQLVATLLLSGAGLDPAKLNKLMSHYGAAGNPLGGASSSSLCTAGNGSAYHEQIAAALAERHERLRRSTLMDAALAGLMPPRNSAALPSAGGNDDAFAAGVGGDLSAAEEDKLVESILNDPRALEAVAANPRTASVVLSAMVARLSRRDGGVGQDGSSAAGGDAGSPKSAPFLAQRKDSSTSPANSPNPMRRDTACVPAGSARPSGAGPTCMNSMSRLTSPQARLPSSRLTAECGVATTPGIGGRFSSCTSVHMSVQRDECEDGASKGDITMNTNSSSNDAPNGGERLLAIERTHSQRLERELHDREQEIVRLMRQISVLRGGSESVSVGAQHTTCKGPASVSPSPQRFGSVASVASVTVLSPSRRATAVMAADPSPSSSSAALSPSRRGSALAAVSVEAALIASAKVLIDEHADHLLNTVVRGSVGLPDGPSGAVHPIAPSSTPSGATHRDDNTNSAASVAFSEHDVLSLELRLLEEALEEKRAQLAALEEARAAHASTLTELSLEADRLRCAIANSPLEQSESLAKITNAPFDAVRRSQLCDQVARSCQMRLRTATVGLQGVEQRIAMAVRRWAQLHGGKGGASAAPSPMRTSSGSSINNGGGHVPPTPQMVALTEEIRAAEEQIGERRRALRRLGFTAKRPHVSASPDPSRGGVGGGTCLAMGSPLPPPASAGCDAAPDDAFAPCVSTEPSPMNASRPPPAQTPQWRREEREAFLASVGFSATGPSTNNAGAALAQKRCPSLEVPPSPQHHPLRHADGTAAGCASPRTPLAASSGHGDAVMAAIVASPLGIMGSGGGGRRTAEDKQRLFDTIASLGRTSRELGQQLAEYASAEKRIQLSLEEEGEGEGEGEGEDDTTEGVGALQRATATAPPSPSGGLRATVLSDGSGHSHSRRASHHNAAASPTKMVRFDAEDEEDACVAAAAVVPAAAAAPAGPMAYSDSDDEALAAYEEQCRVARDVRQQEQRRQSDVAQQQRQSALMDALRSAEAAADGENNRGDGEGGDMSQVDDGGSASSPLVAAAAVDGHDQEHDEGDDVAATTADVLCAQLSEAIAMLHGTDAALKQAEERLQSCMSSEGGPAIVTGYLTAASAAPPSTRPTASTNARLQQQRISFADAPAGVAANTRGTTIHNRHADPYSASQQAHHDGVVPPPPSGLTTLSAYQRSLQALTRLEATLEAQRGALASAEEALRAEVGAVVASMGLHFGGTASTCAPHHQYPQTSSNGGYVDYDDEDDNANSGRLTALERLHRQRNPTARSLIHQQHTTISQQHVDSIIRSTPHLAALQQHVDALRAEVGTSDDAVRRAEVQCVLTNAGGGGEAAAQGRGGSLASSSFPSSSGAMSLRLTAFNNTHSYADADAEGEDGHGHGHGDASGLHGAALGRIEALQDEVRSLADSKAVYVAEVRRLNEELMALRARM